MAMCRMRDGRHDRHKSLFVPCSRRNRIYADLLMRGAERRGLLPGLGHRLRECRFRNCAFRNDSEKRTYISTTKADYLGRRVEIAERVVGSGNKGLLSAESRQRQFAMTTPTGAILSHRRSRATVRWLSRQLRPCGDGPWRSGGRRWPGTCDCHSATGGALICTRLTILLAAAASFS